MKNGKKLLAAAMSSVMALSSVPAASLLSSLSVVAFAAEAAVTNTYETTINVTAIGSKGETEMNNAGYLYLDLSGLSDTTVNVYVNDSTTATAAETKNFCNVQVDSADTTKGLYKVALGTSKTNTIDCYENIKIKITTTKATGMDYAASDFKVAYISYVDPGATAAETDDTSWLFKLTDAGALGETYRKTDGDLLKCIGEGNSANDGEIAVDSLFSSISVQTKVSNKELEKQGKLLKDELVKVAQILGKTKVSDISGVTVDSSDADKTAKEKLRDAVKTSTSGITTGASDSDTYNAALTSLITDEGAPTSGVLYEDLKGKAEATGEHNIAGAVAVAKEALREYNIDGVKVGGKTLLAALNEVMTNAKTILETNVSQYDTETANWATAVNAYQFAKDLYSDPSDTSKYDKLKKDTSADDVKLATSALKSAIADGKLDKTVVQRVTEAKAALNGIVQWKTDVVTAGIWTMQAGNSVKSGAVYDTTKKDWVTAHGDSTKVSDSYVSDKWATYAEKLDAVVKIQEKVKNNAAGKYYLDASVNAQNEFTNETADALRSECLEAESAIKAYNTAKAALVTVAQSKYDEMAAWIKADGAADTINKTEGAGYSDDTWASFYVAYNNAKKFVALIDGTSSADDVTFDSNQIYKHTNTSGSNLCKNKLGDTTHTGNTAKEEATCTSLYTSLKAAMDSMQRVDKAGVTEAIAEGEKAIAIPADYKDEAVTAVRNAITAAKAVEAKDAPTKEECIEAIQAIEAAVKALDDNKTELAIERGKLNALIEANKNNSTTGKTPESVTAYQNALAAAKEAVKGNDLAAIKKAYTDLSAAVGMTAADDSATILKKLLADGASATTTDGDNATDDGVVGQAGRYYNLSLSMGLATTTTDGKPFTKGWDYFKLAYEAAAEFGSDTDGGKTAWHINESKTGEKSTEYKEYIDSVNAAMAGLSLSEEAVKFMKAQDDLADSLTAAGDLVTRLTSAITAASGDKKTNLQNAEASLNTATTGAIAKANDLKSSTSVTVLTAAKTDLDAAVAAAQAIYDANTGSAVVVPELPAAPADNATDAEIKAAAEQAAAYITAKGDGTIVGAEITKVDEAALAILNDSKTTAAEQKKVIELLNTVESGKMPKVLGDVSNTGKLNASDLTQVSKLFRAAMDGDPVKALEAAVKTGAVTETKASLTAADLTAIAKAFRAEM